MPQMMDDSGRVCQSFGRMNEASFSLPSSMLTRLVFYLIPSPRRKFSFRRPVGFTIRTPAFVRLHTARRSNCPVVSNCACNYGFKTCRPRFCLRPVSGDISLRAVLRSSTVIANAQDSRLSCPNRPIIAGCKSNREQQQAAKHDRHDRKHPFPHLNPPSY